VHPTGLGSSEESRIAVEYILNSLNAHHKKNEIDGQVIFSVLSELTCQGWFEATLNHNEDLCSLQCEIHKMLVEKISESKNCALHESHSYSESSDAQIIRDDEFFIPSASTPAFKLFLKDIQALKNNAPALKSVGERVLSPKLEENGIDLLMSCFAETRAQIDVAHAVSSASESWSEEVSVDDK
jgi:hypothetical protein